jgi:hypothetical protein
LTTTVSTWSLLREANIRATSKVSFTLVS